MASDEQWYVLVEANSSYSPDTEWQLRERRHVEGDRSAALSRVERRRPGRYVDLSDGGR